MVESVILAMSVGLLVWIANVVVTHSEKLASQGTQIQSNNTRLDRMEVVGSPAVGELKNRVEKLESAVIGLQSAPGELKAIAVRLDSLKEGQARIEQMVQEHLKKP